MDELLTAWNNETNMNELKQRLHQVTVERDGLRDRVHYMTNLLQASYNERDEYKCNLEMLLTNLGPPSPDFQMVKANSSVTESNSLSDVYNHHSHGSPGVDSFLEGGSSADFPTMNISDSCNMSFADRPSRLPVKMDRESAVIENLAKGLVLPPKGQLLSSVIGAGPLLQSLLVAGSLPQWKNPPPVQTFKIPHVSMTGNEGSRLNVSRSSPLVISGAQKMQCLHPQADMARGSMQVCSASLLDFGRSGRAIGMGNMPMNRGICNNVHAVNKRARMQ